MGKLGTDGVRRFVVRIPILRGVIDRRILVNYRVDPSVLAPLVPSPFRPKVVRGVGVVGICLIRLKQVRPTFFPPWLGIASENAAHRTAVEWDDRESVRDGVYIRRRDTNSWLNSQWNSCLSPPANSGWPSRPPSAADPARGGSRRRPRRSWHPVPPQRSWRPALRSRRRDPLPTAHRYWRSRL